MGHKNRIPLILIFIIGLSIYAHILHAPAQIDDHDLLFKNPHIKDLAQFCRHGYTQNTQKALTLLTFAINYFFSQENTFSYHLVNVILHIFTAFFLYYFVLALSPVPELSKSSFPKGNFLALLIALIFLVHPLQTEAVTYLWQRSEALSGLFYMAALWSYLKGRLQRKKLYYILTGFLFVTGFFAKGTIVTLPLMILLMEVAFFQFERVGSFLRKAWPYVVIGVVGFASALNEFSAKYLHYDIAPAYVLTQLRVFWKYIGLAFFPVHQNVDHDVYRSASLGDPMTFFSFLALIALIGTTIWLFNRHRLMAVGILWFIIYLLPTSLFLRDPMWEHRLYFSLAGFAIFLAAGIFTLFSNPKLRTGLAVSIVLVLSTLTVMRNTLWRSPVLLLEDSVKKSPYKARPHHMLGTAYLNENQLKKAFEQFQAVLYLDPHYADAYNNLGLIFIRTGDPQKAIPYFERAIALNDYLETPYINLAYIFLYTKGDLAKAEKLFKKSLDYRQTAEGYVGLGNLYLEQKDYEQAREAFTSALKLSYQNPVIFHGLGNVFYYQNDYQKALAMYNKAIDLDRYFMDSYYNIGMIYRETKEFELSRQWMEKAREISTERK